MAEEVKTPKVDFYISGSAGNIQILKNLVNKIEEEGLTCFSYLDVDPSNSYHSLIPQVIKSAKAFIFLLDKNALSSNVAASELMLAYHHDVPIFPIYLEDIDINGCNLEYYLAMFNYIKVNNGDYERAFKEVIDIYKENVIRKQLYEKLSEYIHIKHLAYIYRTIEKIVQYLPHGICLDRNYGEYSEYYKTISLLHTMHQFVDDLDEDFEARKDFSRARDEFKKLIKVNNEDQVNLKDIKLINLAIYLYLLIESRSMDEDALDVFSNGHASFGFTPSFIGEINKYEPIFGQLLNEEIKFFQGQESQERDLIFKVKQLLSQTVYEMNEYLERRKTSAAKAAEKANESQEEDDFGSVLHFTGATQKVPKPLSELEKQLFEVAEYIHHSNIVFTKIAANKPTHEFLICLKTSYERLKNYCEIVGCKEVSAYCIDKISEINVQLERVGRDSGASDLKEDSFKALLGFTLPSSGKYNAFISYKHEDEDLATKVYDFFNEHLIHVFFDKITLPKLGKSEYHEAIMESLDKSKNFIVVLSDLSYLESHWVSLEMKTFEHEMVEGRKPDANFIFIVTPEVYAEIKRTNKSCLLIQYRDFEIMSTTDYKDRILQYIKPDFDN